MSYSTQAFRPVATYAEQTNNQTNNQQGEQQYVEYAKDEGQTNNQAATYNSPEAAQSATAAPARTANQPVHQTVNQPNAVYQTYQATAYQPVQQANMHDGSMAHTVIEQQHYEIVEDDSHLHHMHRRGTIAQPISQPINQTISQPMNQPMAYQTMQFQTAPQPMRPQQGFRPHMNQAINQPRYTMVGMPVVHHPMSLNQPMNQTITQPMHQPMTEMPHVDSTFAPIQPVVASASPPAAIQMMEPPGRKKKTRTARRCQDREKHSKAEQKRRGEMKILFDQLQEISQCVYKDRIHILSLAIQTIQKQKEAIAELQAQVHKKKKKRENGDTVKTEPTNNQSNSTSNSPQSQTHQISQPQQDMQQMSAAQAEIQTAATMVNMMQTNNQQNNQMAQPAGYSDYHFVDGNSQFQPAPAPATVIQHPQQPQQLTNEGQYGLPGAAATHTESGWSM